MLAQGVKNPAKYPDWDKAFPAVSSDLPFQGYKTIFGVAGKPWTGLTDLYNQFYWDIALELNPGNNASDSSNNVSSVPTNPYGRWIPATDYTLDYESINNRQIQITESQAISIPIGLSKVPKITLTVLENVYFSFQTYKRQYEQWIYPVDQRGMQLGTVRPYKDCTSKLTLYVTDPSRTRYYQYVEFYVIPELSFSLHGESQPNIYTENMVFNIVGEGANAGFYSDNGNNYNAQSVYKGPKT